MRLGSELWLGTGPSVKLPSRKIASAPVVEGKAPMACDDYRPIGTGRARNLLSLTERGRLRMDRKSYCFLFEAFPEKSSA